MRRVTVIVIGAVVSLIALNLIFPMLSGGDNTHVLVGFGIMALLVIFWLNIGWSVIQHVMKAIFRGGEKGGANIHHLVALVVAAFAVMTSTGCGRTVIEPGHVGITV